MGKHQLSKKTTHSFEFSNWARTAIIVGCRFCMLFEALARGVTVKGEEEGNKDKEWKKEDKMGK